MRPRGVQDCFEQCKVSGNAYHMAILYSRQSIVENGSIVVPSIVARNDRVLSLGGWCSGNETSCGQGSSNSFGEVHDCRARFMCVGERKVG